MSLSVADFSFTTSAAFAFVAVLFFGPLLSVLLSSKELSLSVFALTVLLSVSFALTISTSSTTFSSFSITALTLSFFFSGALGTGASIIL
jgi:ABC-type spermidine/putrescine transport system permease subunit I